MTKKDIIKSFFSQHKILVISNFILGFFEGILTIFIPIVLTHFFSFLFDINSYRVQYLLPIPEMIKNNFWNYVIFFFSIIFIRFLLGFSFRYYTGKIGELFAMQIKNKLFKHQIDTDISLYDKRGTGRFLLRYSGDLGSVQNYITKGIIRFFKDILVVGVAFIFLMQIHIYFGVLFLIIFLISFFILSFPAKKLYHISEKRRNIKSRVLSFVSERFISIKSIRSFNKEYTEVKKFNRQTEDIYEEGKKYFFWQSLIFSSVPFILYSTILGIIILIYFQNHNNELLKNGPVLFVAILIFISIIPVCRRLLNIHPTWKKGDISFKKLIRIFELPLQKSGRKKIKNIAHHLEIKNINLIHQKNISFSISEKGIYQIKIKNTEDGHQLLQFILGLQFPKQGNIFLDNISCNTIDGKSWRRQISIISNHWNLLGKTVFEAISYSRKKEKRIIAQKIVEQLQQNIAEEHQLNLNQRIGEFGNNISLEQQKTLQYARAFLTEKPFIFIESPFEYLSHNIKKNILDFLNEKQNEYSIILLDTDDFSELKIKKIFDFT